MKAVRTSTGPARLIRRSGRALVPIALLLGAAACESGVSGIDTSDGLQVLFIGNSLTFFDDRVGELTDSGGVVMYPNDVPGMLEALIDSADAGPAEIDLVAFGGFGLQDHWESGPARQMIARGGWDVVVLQQGPSAHEGRPSLLEYSRRFADEIRRVGARPALYMVWAAADRQSDFDAVSDSYRTAAKQVNALLFPVGEAWRAAWRRDSTLALYGPDVIHPSVAGTYVAALVMFEQLTGRSPIGLPASLELPSSPLPLSVPPHDAAILQQAAQEANRRFALSFAPNS